MKLSFYDRLIIPGLLPTKATIEKAIVIADIKKKINITQDEVKAVGLKTLPSGALSFDDTKEAPFEVEFTVLETLQIADSLRQAGTEGSLPAEKDAIDLYHRFTQPQLLETK